MTGTRQATIADRIKLSGIGVHSGKPTSVVLRPAPSDSGIIFVKTDEASGAEVEMPVHHRFVVGTALSTVLGDSRIGQIGTVEHLLAAVAGLGIDNLMIEIDGDEVPIMDGSADAFVAAISEVGLRRQAERRRFIKVLKPVRVSIGDAVGELLPHEGRRVEIEIDFDTDLIGRQAYVFDYDAGDFCQELSRARTFGFMRDVQKLWSKGFALGASLENTVVVGEGEVVNPEGLRFADEFVRHKALDAVGDLTLAGAPILGAYRSVRGGHRLNCAVVEALLGDHDAWTWSERARRREPAQAGVGAMVPAAAFGPEIS